MTRANPGQFYQLDSELERNLRKSRRRLELRCSTEGVPSSSEPTTESVPLESPLVINISSDPSPELEIQEDRMEERTIRELASPDAAITQNMCIQYPDGECELKSGLIHLLPKFHGLAGEVGQAQDFGVLESLGVPNFVSFLCLFFSLFFFCIRGVLNFLG